MRPLCETNLPQPLPHCQADGVLPLTVPVQGRSRAQGGDSKTPMHEMRLSEHGRWREMHLNALTAAYERTPYFEYYVDEFAEIYRTLFERLVDFNAAFQQLVLRLLDMTPQWSANEGGLFARRRASRYDRLARKDPSQGVAGLRPHVSPCTLLPGVCRPQWFSAQPEYCRFAFQYGTGKSARFCAIPSCRVPNIRDLPVAGGRSLARKRIASKLHRPKWRPARHKNPTGVQNLDTTGHKKNRRTRRKFRVRRCLLQSMPN